MSILTGLSLDIIQANRWEIAQEFAQKWQVTLILKGAVSVIAATSGKIWVSPVSDAALATAGSGDVLSGVIGGLMAQGVSLPEAGVAGTWLHTGAGVKARKKLGTDISVTAMDILNGISSVFDSLTGTESFNQTSWD
jgi:NAD(P)H-hydrate epimerase